MSDIPTTQFQVPPAPPYDDGGDEPEFRPRPRRRAHTLTFVLAGVAIAALGFLLGVLVQKHDDHGRIANATTTSATRTGRGGGTGTGTGAGGGRFAGFGGGGGGGGAVIGQVKLVDGKNVYVTDTNGDVTKVVTTGSSTITKTDPATVKNIAPGDTVIVRGTQNSDGSTTAASLTDSGASGGGFGSFGAGGGGGAGSGG